MAQIEGGGDSGSHKKGPGVKKAKKLSTRVDMTPMVDLGFLLITFFIFTTTMSSPKALNLNMPKDTKNEEELNKAKESGALTIMLGKNNGVYYYEGQLAPDGSNFKTANFATIRDEIINKKKDVIKTHVHDSNCPKIWAENKGDKNSCLDRDFVVVIKPDEDATYRNTVDILDEMTINNVKRYAMIDITPQELEVVKKVEESNK
ncbi:MAG TPA: biopolymer transporter ExbD [Chitinophagaceae bacterium]|jgi:biopolymer transport protein ExbD|nr:biopolymer transporter ExbD [Chitinophagaceae bacterium]